MIFEIDGVIKEKAELQDGIFYLSVEAPSIAYLAGPGQFVLVRVSPSFDPFLRRPLSIAGTKDDRIKLLFSIVGRGTSLLSRMREGDVLSLRGPLGKSFPPSRGRSSSCWWRDGSRSASFRPSGLRREVGFGG